MILTEALAELSAVAHARNGIDVETIGVLVEDKMRYRQIVSPGDIVRLEAEITQQRLNIGFSNVRALKGDKVVVEGTLSFAIIYH